MAWMLAGGSMAAAETRVALVVGNSGYVNVDELPNPRHDAQAMAEVLRRVGFQVELQIDLDQRAMQRALRDFGLRAENADVALLYYAGHGMQVANENYLLPIDAALRRERDLIYEAQPLSVVFEEVAQARKIGIAIFDACRDNPLAENLREALGPVRANLVGRGLAQVEGRLPPNANILVGFSTRPGEVAIDGLGEHSPYTEALLQHIPEEGVELSLMFRKVKESVLAMTAERQEPRTFDTLGADPFYFVPRATNNPPDLAQPEPLAVAADAGPTSLGIAPPMDPDGDAIAVQVTALPAGGTVEVGGRVVMINDVLTSDELAAVTFTPSGEFAGNVGSLAFLVRDDRGGVVGGQVPITILQTQATAMVTEELLQLKELLETRAAELEQQRQALEAEWQERLSALDQELAARQQSFERQGEQLVQLDQQLQERQALLRQREQALAQQQGELAQLEEESIRAREENQARYRELVQEVEAQRSRLAEERRALDDRESELHQLRAASELQQQELAAMEAAHSARLQDLERERMAVQQERQVLDEDREAFLEGLASAPDPDQLARIEVSLRERETQIAGREAKLSEEWQNLEIERNERLAALDQELAARRAQFEQEQAARLEQFERKLLEREQTLQVREQTTEQREAEIAQLEADVVGLQESLLQTREQDRAEYRRRLAEAEQRLADAAAEKARLQEERSGLEAAKEDLARLRSQDEAHRNALAAAETEQSKRIAELAADRAELELERQSLQLALADLANAPKPDELSQRELELSQRETEIAAREADLKVQQQALESEKDSRLVALGQGLTAQESAFEGEAQESMSAEQQDRGGPRETVAAVQPEETSNVPAPTAPAAVLPGGRGTESGVESEPEAIDSEFLVLRDANVRARPTTSSAVVGVLTQNARVFVRHKIPGQEWYQIERADGQTAYVHASLLGELSEERLALLQAEERQAAEAQRRAAEAQRAEEERRAAEARRQAAEAARVEQERQAAEAQRRAVEAQRAEEERRAAEAQRHAAEAVRAEQERQAAEAQRRAAEAQRAEQERQAAEARRQAADAARAEQERRAAEAQRRAAEAQRAEQERQAAEARRQAAEAARAEQERQMAALTEEAARRPPQSTGPEQRTRTAAAVLRALTREVILGRWCGDAISLVFAPSRLTFILPENQRAEYEITDYRIYEDIIEVHWRDDRNRHTVTEFGQFSVDQQSIVQLRGRIEPDGEWHDYDRRFRRC